MFCTVFRLYIRLRTQAKKLIGADVKHDTKIRIDLINHNINVIDTAIYILDKYKISYESMTTEKDIA